MKRGFCMRLCKMALMCVFASFCAFVRISAPFFLLPKSPAKKGANLRRILQNVQNALSCSTPFSYTPFGVSPMRVTKQ